MHDQATRLESLDRARHCSIAAGVEIDGLSLEIVRPWQRARDTYGIDPAQYHCSRLLPSSELTHRRDENEVYRLSLPVLEKFGAQLASTPSVVTFFDATGCMLSIGGNPQTVDHLARINFFPGAIWREEPAGANGLGTAMNECRSVAVFAAEHSIEAEQSCCSAAPILAPGSSELLGLVDIKGPCNAHHVQALVAARAIAQAVEERLRSVQLVRDQVVEYAFRSESASADGLFAIDGHGRVIAVNERARRRLSIQGREIPLPVREALEAVLRQRAGALAGELLVDWPGVAGKVTLLTSLVRYEEHTVGTVVRVPAPADSPRARPPARAPSSGSVRYDFGQILGESDALLQAIALARVASRNELPVVLSGESGTGDPLREHPRRRPLHRRELRLHPGVAPRGRALRLRVGYVHGRATGREGRQVRGGERRDGLPRRGE
jgi:transcriptional regulator of acetoin/glycerol metabolism